VPYGVKAAVLKDTAWSAMLKSATEEDADIAELVDDDDDCDDEAGNNNQTGQKRKVDPDGAKKGKDAKSPGKKKDSKKGKDAKSPGKIVKKKKKDKNEKKEK
jgi:hypothetical protein